MKVIIIAALTADGFIGRTSDQSSTEWTNKEDRYLFKTFVQEAGGNMVMGFKTFMTTAQKYPTVFTKSMPGRRLFVYTHHPEAVASYPEVDAVSESPQDLVKRLAAEGLETLTICGGSQVYTMFMRAGVVDDIYINAQATLFGEGVPLFNAPLDAQISLADTKLLGDNNLLMHYHVMR